MNYKTPILNIVCLLAASTVMAMPNFGSRQNVGIPDHPGLNENSGICMSRKNPHIIWIQVDSGEVGDDYVYAVTTNGTCVGVYAINGFYNADWEDIAIGPGPIDGVDYLYIADIGDNQSDDATQTIARVPEPAVNPTQSIVTNTLYGADIITVEYASGFKMDAESLMVDSNKNIYIVGKRTGADWWPSDTPRLYLTAYPQSTSAINTMSLEGTISITGNAMPTGADIAPSGEQILIKIGGGGLFGPQEVWHWSVSAGESITDALITSPSKTEVTKYSNNGQCEAVGWAHHDGGFYTISEGTSAPLYYYDNQDVGTYCFLNTEVIGSGTITPSDGWHSTGTSVTVTATPAAQHVFDSWSGDTSGWTVNDNEISGVMDQDHEITAIIHEYVVPNPSNILNYVETFESYTNGFTMPGLYGWSATAVNKAVVSTNASSIEALADYSAECGYPVASDAHDKVLKVDGAVTNSFDINISQVVWVDYMVQAYSISTPDINIMNNPQVAIYFNNDGHPMIMHKDIDGGTNRWTEISEVTIPVGQWVRVTLKLDYKTVDASNNVKYFQARIDGELQSSAVAYTSNNGSGTTGGSWFAMSSINPDRLTRIIFDGKGGDIDDLVVTTYHPFTPGSVFLIK